MEKKKIIKKISNRIKKCKKCPLWKDRLNPVVGDGSLDSNLMFIGEAPGRNEDIKGKPFVGKAGKILDELLNEINVKRKEVYICNIIKCRPSSNRNPKKDEIRKCSKYLNEQIKLIKPKIIAPLGNFSSKYIFNKYGLEYEKIGKIHAETFISEDSSKITIVPLYHPAAAIYNPNKKKVLLEDIKKLRENVFMHF
ncbi:MAG: uracil-DNA glycosylase [Candidatus Thermoplasmatota archaeon]